MLIMLIYTAHTPSRFQNYMPPKRNASRTKKEPKSALPKEKPIRHSSEHGEQCQIFEWKKLAQNMYPELRFLFSVPNGAKLPYRRGTRGGKIISISPERARLLAEGILPGVSDMFLPVAKNGKHGLFIELKYSTNKPTLEQENFLNGMAENGYATAVCWSAESAIKVISTYLGIEQWKDT